MDLGAFLQPGKLYPVSIQSAATLSIDSRPGRGSLCFENGQLTWSYAKSCNKGEDIILEIELKDFYLEEDGSLTAKEGAAALISIAAKVLDCRTDSQPENYILDLNILGRILP